jgi:hypothetical protein
VVTELKIKVGDKVAEGTLVALVRVAAAQGASAPAPAVPVAVSAPVSASAAVPPAPTSAPVAGTFAGKADLECEMLVLGAGPGGYSAAFRAADLGMKTVIVERYATLGGVCLNVGCIPSKALLHVAAVMEEAEHGDLGVSFAAPKVDIDKLRAHKEKVVGKLTGGLAGMAKARKVETVRGYGHFLDANHLEVEDHGRRRRTRPARRRSSASRSASSPPAARPSTCPSFRRSAHRRFHRRAGTAPVPKKHAGHRRRHHRPGNGDGVFDAGRESRCGRNARRPDAGPGPRPGQGLGKAERQALRQGHAEDQDRCGRGQADGLWVSFEGEKAPPNRSATT